jgi:site-specific DNA-methyltransferase (adenine-specific)
MNSNPFFNPRPSLSEKFQTSNDLSLKNVGDNGRHFIFADQTSYPVVFRAIYGKAKTALLVWDKGRIGMGREFRKQFELIMHAWGNSTKVAESNGHGYSDILKCPPVIDSEKLHPAQKPVNLIIDLLRVSGESVLDPFIGSGTTAVACEITGRRWIGIEIEEKYCEIAAKRIEAERKQLKLF